MRITIKIDCDNDAFFENLDTQVAFILDQQVLPALRAREKIKRLKDSNGNTVGFFRVQRSK